jgi:hypothetical protein
VKDLKIKRSKNEKKNLVSQYKGQGIKTYLTPKRHLWLFGPYAKVGGVGKRQEEKRKHSC